MKLTLKKLFESFFQPEMPSQTNAHQYRSSYRNETGNRFPYADPKGDLDCEEDKALGMSGKSTAEIEEGALFDFTTQAGSPPTNVTDIAFSKLKGGADIRRTNPRDPMPTMSVKDFFGEENPEENQEKLDNADDRLAVQARVIEGVGDRYKMPTDIVSTKQPFKNGLPRSDQPWDPQTELEKEEEIIDGYQKNDGYMVHEVIEGFNYATTNSNEMEGSKKVKGAKSDLHFIDDEEHDHPYLQVSLEDFFNGDGDEK